jgi:hypothetical protein
MTPDPCPKEEIHSRKLPVMCAHQPTCPVSDAPDAHAAHVVAAHPEQGWSLLCNGVLLFEDGGELLPGGRTVEPVRVLPPVCRRTAA